MAAFVWTRPPAAVGLLCLMGAAALGCRSSNDVTGPTRTLVIAFSSPVTARVVTCSPCEEPSMRLVAEFPVTVADPAGPGGTVDRVEVVVRNLSRAIEVGRNVRPNKDHGYGDVSVPPGGSLTLDAGIVFGLPPPRDEIELTVTVHLTDGRTGTRRGSVHVVF